MAKEVAELCEKPANTFSWKKNSYNHRYPDIDQVGAYRQERLPFRSSTFNATSSKLSFTDIVEEVDDINNDAIDGTLDYKSYKVKIDKLNKILKDQKCIYKVTLIPENKLQELLHMWPNQMVVYENSDEQIYDDSYYGGYVL